MNDTFHAICSITFFMSIFLYVWLKIKEKTHDVVRLAFDNFKNKEDEEETNTNEMSNPYVYNFKNLTLMPFSMMLRVCIFIFLFVIGIMIFGFFTKNMSLQPPTQQLLETVGRIYLRFSGAPPTTKPLKHDTERVTSVLTTIIKQKKSIWNALLITMITVLVYNGFAIPLEDRDNHEAMHMHVDVLMFIILVIFSYTVYTIYKLVYLKPKLLQ